MKPHQSSTSHPQQKNSDDAEKIAGQHIGHGPFFLELPLLQYLRIPRPKRNQHVRARRAGDLLRCCRDYRDRGLANFTVYEAHRPQLSVHHPISIAFLFSKSLKGRASEGACSCRTARIMSACSGLNCSAALFAAKAASSSAFFAEASFAISSTWAACRESHVTAERMCIKIYD